MASCSPAARFDRSASKLEFERSLVEGSGFEHVVYQRPPLSSAKSDDRHRVLHVYLGGDGTPWLTPAHVASDPTPRNPLTLRLMALDPAKVLYLGRPCYHGLAQSAPCTPAMWTHLRYSETVVASMTDALNRILAEMGEPDIVLLGYSGGGTLAMLIAERISRTRALVTVAANLDPDKWTSHHGYTPLYNSLNPVKRQPLPPDVVQLHYWGENDTRVPPQLFGDWFDVRPQATSNIFIIPTYTHVCCWEDLWPDVLDEVRTQILSASN